MQMQMQRRVDENTESERIQYIELDRIWGKKVISICGVVLLAGLLAGLIAMMVPVNYAPIYPIYPIYPTMVRIYEYMVSYTICSHSVMCKIVSFVTMIISIAIFMIIVILIILLSSILFLAFIFAFTRV
jgi:hypothetical protein